MRDDFYDKKQMTKEKITNNKLKDWVKPKSVREANPIVLTCIGVALSVAWLARGVYTLATHGSTVVSGVVKLVVFVNGVLTIYNLYTLASSVGFVPLLELGYTVTKYAITKSLGY